MLMLGMGPVGRMVTLLDDCCTKAVSVIIIKTAHARTTKEPESHRFALPSFGLSGLRTPGGLLMDLASLDVVTVKGRLRPAIIAPRLRLKTT
jgi:hypothetical protein